MLWSGLWNPINMGEFLALGATMLGAHQYVAGRIGMGQYDSGKTYNVIIGIIIAIITIIP